MRWGARGFSYLLRRHLRALSGARRGQTKCGERWEQRSSLSDGYKYIYTYNQKAQSGFKAQDCPPQALTPHPLPVPSLGSGHTVDLLKSRDSSQASGLGIPPALQSWFCFFCFCFLVFLVKNKQKCRSLCSLENQFLMQCFPPGFLRL